MSTFYVRNIVRGNYVRFLNSDSNRHISSQTMQSRNSNENNSRNNSADLISEAHLSKSTNVPSSRTSSNAIEENGKYDVTDPSFSNNRSLPEVDVNLSFPSSEKNSKKTDILSMIWISLFSITVLEVVMVFELIMVFLVHRYV